MAVLSTALHVRSVLAAISVTSMAQPRAPHAVRGPLIRAGCQPRHAPCVLLEAAALLGSQLAPPVLLEATAILLVSQRAPPVRPGGSISRLEAILHWRAPSVLLEATALLGSQLAPPVLLEAAAAVLGSQLVPPALLEASAALGSLPAPSVLLEATAVLLANQFAPPVLLGPSIPRLAARLRHFAPLVMQGSCACKKGSINKCRALQVTTALRV